MSRNRRSTSRETSRKSTSFCDSFPISPDFKIERHAVSPEYRAIYATRKWATLTSRDVARMSRLRRDNVALASHITSRFGTSFLPHSNKLYFIKISWSFAHVIENQCPWAHFVGLEALYFAIINKYIKKNACVYVIDVLKKVTMWLSWMMPQALVFLYTFICI